MLSVQGLEHINSTEQVLIAIYTIKAGFSKKALNFNSLALFENSL